MEGEQYITISLIPYHICMIRDHLQNIINDVASNASIVNLAKLMLEKFNTDWGSGVAGTVLIENATMGPKKRKKGFPKRVLLAACVDPRTKDLDGIPKEEHGEIWKLLQTEMVQYFSNDAISEDIVAETTGNYNDTYLL